MSSATFDDRIVMARAFEWAVQCRLEELGWTACEWGQGLLSPEMRDALRATSSLVRWTPDILAVRGDAVRWVDAKSGLRYQDTGNHDIETKSLDAAEAARGIASVLFVFPDWRVATPVLVRERGWPGPYRGNGSGTPFVLVRATDCSPFDEVFR